MSYWASPLMTCPTCKGSCFQVWHERKKVIVGRQYVMQDVPVTVKCERCDGKGTVRAIQRAA